MFKKPNFFIIGAPKCGTTSLAAWLSEHPQVYVSDPKEPDYFDHDRRKGYSDDLARYEGFFDHVTEGHVAIGEASTGYLRSRVAVEEILRYSPAAKFVVGLRNPVDMAISWHGQTIFAAWEDEHDFERAWHLQDARRAGRSVPRLCADRNDLLYGEVCRLGAQMARLYSFVPKDRVFVYTLDEMRAGPRELWLRLLDFLGVPDDGRDQFPALNEAKSVPALLRIATRLVFDLKRKTGFSKYGFGLLNRLNRSMARKRRVAVPGAFRAELVDYFREDIQLLARVTGRDFSAWLADLPVVEGGIDKAGGHSGPSDACREANR